MPVKLIVIGGGAAGFFGAINYAGKNPGNEVLILEKSNKLLSKVKVSGGGRCNVTNVITDPKQLSGYFPRGGKELIGPFSRFSSSDTVKWFQKRGVKLKAEEDGRIFPVTDDSQTIINLFLREAEKLKIKIYSKKNINKIIFFDRKWNVIASDGSFYSADKLLIAPGSSESIWKILEDLGHNIIKPVPSLFTFNIKDERIKNLSGISVPACEIKIEDINIKTTGPLLITHWGLSGPAILKLSSWAARELSRLNYKFKIKVNFVPGFNSEKLLNELQQMKKISSRKIVSGTPHFKIPLRLWEKLCDYSGAGSNLKWNDISRKTLQKFSVLLPNSEFNVMGKSTFKEEFVTCGGISLAEIDFKTMQSKLLPDIYFAGEVIDVDGITGGFNFQSAWTTSWIAAESM
jgi:predicted Rossmann fold flavoprotein